MMPDWTAISTRVTQIIEVLHLGDDARSVTSGSGRVNETGPPICTPAGFPCGARHYQPRLLPLR